MLRVVNAVGVVLTTQGEEALPVVAGRLQDLLSKLTPAADQLRWLVTLGILVEVLTVAPPTMFEAYFTSCINQVKESCGAGGFFTPLRSLEVRRMAYAALRQFAAKGGAAFGPHVGQTVSMCTTVLSSDYDEEEDDQLRLRDTAAGTLAAVFEHHLPQVPGLEQNLAIWLEWLPIKSDEEQVEPCISALCRLALTGPLAPSPGTIKQYGKVLATLGDLKPGDNDISPEVTALVRAVLQTARSLPPELAKAMRALSASQRRNLEKWCTTA